MFQTRVTRIGIVVAFAGLAVLGASLFHWARTTFSKGLFYSTNHYEWVTSSASSKPAFSRDEIWTLPAPCVKQFHARQIENLNAQLAAHVATKPSKVVLAPPKSLFGDIAKDRPLQDWERSVQVMDLKFKAINQVAEAYGPVDPDERRSLERALDQNNLDVDPIWFATRFHLEYLIKRWTNDVASLEDKQVLLSEVLAAARGESSGRSQGFGMSVQISGATNDEAKMDIAASYLLSLTSFSASVAKTIRATCIKITPMKQILSGTTYGTDIAQWPIESPIFFWAGIALTLFGLLLGPAFMWIRAAG